MKYDLVRIERRAQSTKIIAVADFAEKKLIEQYQKSAGKEKDLKIDNLSNLVYTFSLLEFKNKGEVLFSIERDFAFLDDHTLLPGFRKMKPRPPSGSAT